MPDGDLRFAPTRIDPPGGGRRGRAVVIAFVGILLAVAGIGVAGGGRHERSAVDAGPSGASRSASTSPAATAAARAPLPLPLPGLPRLPDRILDDAPDVVFVRRAGADAYIDVWSARERRLVTVDVFADAFRGLPGGGSTTAELAPDRERLLVHAVAEPAIDRGDRFRIVGRDGSTVWESPEVPFGSVSAWSPDGSTAVVSAGVDWLVVDVLERPIERKVRVTDAGARDTAPTVAGFARDSKWIYGVRRGTPPGGGWIATVAVARDGGSARAVDILPAVGPDALLPGTPPGGTIDPSTGRSIELGNGLGPVPPSVSVFEPDGSLAWRTPVPGLVLLGAGWTEDGRVLVLGSDRLVDASVAVLAALGADGTVGPAVIATGAVASARWIVAREGYALIGLLGRHGDGEDLGLAVLIRAADGATATLPVYRAELANVAGIQLLEPVRP